MTETAELTETECLRLLGTGTVGRLVFTEAAMPAAAPVGYLLDGDEVIFRVPRDGPLAAATRNLVIGFQTDDIDPTTHRGWSVLGVGRTYEVTDPSRRAVYEHTPRWDPAATMPIARMSIIALPLRRLGGHRIGPAPILRGPCGDQGR